MNFGLDVLFKCTTFKMDGTACSRTTDIMYIIKFPTVKWNFIASATQNTVSCQPIFIYSLLECYCTTNAVHKCSWVMHIYCFLLWLHVLTLFNWPSFGHTYICIFLSYSHHLTTIIYTPKRIKYISIRSSFLTCHINIWLKYPRIIILV